MSSALPNTAATPSRLSFATRCVAGRRPAALIIGFDANIDRLIQLHIVGGFTRFPLSQFGMVKHRQMFSASTLRGRRTPSPRLAGSAVALAP